MTRIAIIGAGLSGRLVALHLLREASPAIRVRWIDRGDARYMGPAYSVDVDYLLLNVPAWRMGALPEEEEHFLNWARRRGIPAEQADFLPRRLYRDYILDLLHEARRERPNGPRVEHVRGEVSDIVVGRDGATIDVEGAESFLANKVVLALGNFPPRHPAILNRAALESRRYAGNPWTPGLLDTVARKDTVLLIGTGQTTVDLVVSLEKRGHEGRIVALSRRGILPLPHRVAEPYPPFFAEIAHTERLIEILRVVRKHFARAESMGSDIRAVIDSMRPDTQALWQALPVEEKRRFLRHLARHWEIIRSRIPPASEAVVDAMRSSGRLEIVAGRICDFVETPSALEVRYTPRGGAGAEVVRAGIVINCVGPESEYERIDQPLVKNLMRRGLMRPGTVNLGIDALPNGAVVGRDGEAAGVLWTLGPPLRGALWEVTAVPEIRVQARRLARILLESEA